MSDLRLNDALLNEANYSDTKALKKMLTLYSRHERDAYRGDSVAHVIWIDLKTAINSGVLTPKQREVVKLRCIGGLQTDKIGEMLGIKRQSVQDRLEGAVKNLQKILLSGDLYAK